MVSYPSFNRENILNMAPPIDLSQQKAFDRCLEDLPHEVIGYISSYLGRQAFPLQSVSRTFQTAIKGYESQLLEAAGKIQETSPRLFDALVAFKRSERGIEFEDTIFFPVHKEDRLEVALFFDPSLEILEKGGASLLRQKGKDWALLQLAKRVGCLPQSCGKRAIAKASLLHTEAKKSWKILYAHQQRFSKREKLDLSGCYFGEVPCGLRLFVSLQRLDLCNNYLDSLKELPAFQKLRSMNLLKNRLTHLKEVPELPKLKDLNLYMNHFSSLEGIERLPRLRLLQIEYYGFFLLKEGKASPRAVVPEENQEETGGY